MKKNSIVQFVCFVTNLDLDEFIPKWDHYAKQFKVGSDGTILQEAEGKYKYKYVSQHACREETMRFAVAKGRNSDHFGEQKAKVLQVGGYSVLQTGHTGNDENANVKIIAFIGHSETDIDFYRQLSHDSTLNIYEAYYESCAFGYILEYFTSESNEADLLQQLRNRHGVDVAVYKECLVPQS